ncbi:MAG: hypothetical protein ACREKH_05025, partial [Candidatus Rokuibacteriota bacterium]
PGWLPGTASLVLALLLTSPAVAAEKVPFLAKAGVPIADAAAHSWASDAILVYLENDEDVDAAGACERWGYLYYSPSQQAARVFSVRNGKILVAENLEMLFDAPPLATQWIDSGQAMAVAEQMAGQSFRQLHQGKLSTMLLMRGAFHSGDPNQTTWTLIYTSPHAPSLFVVVDAADGSVRRTWRG